MWNRLLLLYCELCGIPMNYPIRTRKLLMHNEVGEKVRIYVLIINLIKRHIIFLL